MSTLIIMIDGKNGNMMILVMMIIDNIDENDYNDIRVIHVLDQFAGTFNDIIIL